jgi:hypothetical protein
MIIGPDVLKGACCPFLKPPVEEPCPIFRSNFDVTSSKCPLKRTQTDHVVQCVAGFVATRIPTTYNVINVQKREPV